MLPKKSNWEVIEHYNPRGGLTGVPSSQTKVGLTGVPSSQTKVGLSGVRSSQTKVGLTWENQQNRPRASHAQQSFHFKKITETL